MKSGNLNKKKIISLFDFNKELKFLSNDKNRVLISGGSSLDKIYKLANLKKISLSANFYLSDERIDKNYKSSSNLYNIKKKIKKIKINPDYDFKKYRILDYEEILKNHFIHLNKIDYAILGFGLDGHICGLFEKNQIIQNSIKQKNKFIYLKHRKDNFYRINISYNMITKIKKIYLIINSLEKLNYLFDTMILKKNKDSFLFKIIAKKKDLKFIYCV